MPSARHTSENRLLLGIEGGATRTVALLTDRRRKLIRRVAGGPGNLRLLTDRQLLHRLRSLGIPGRNLAAVALGMAGARTPADRERLRAAAARVWPGVPCQVTHDLDTGLAAAPKARPSARYEVLVLSGTGACCYGRAGDGRTVKVGGWGHHLGDRGSGYDIGRRSLERVLAEFDVTGRWPALGVRLLHQLTLNEPEDLINWVQTATKSDVAALAVAVFDAARSGDRLARRLVDEAARSLATDALACARRLRPQGRPVRFVLAGGTLLHQPAYARTVRDQLLRGCRQATVVRLRREGAWGAVDLADHLAAQEAPPVRAAGRTPPAALPEHASTPSAPVPLRDLAKSPTEQRHPRSAQLDRMSLRAAIGLFLTEERHVPAALRQQARAIEQACRLVARALKTGGRLFYVGAGTSGRLGVLDASECPPTFCSPPGQIQGIIAGGARALAESVEGAEDDYEAGSRAVEFRRAGPGDVVVGVAASGRTPFVWGALDAARVRRAHTVLLCFNPALRTLRGLRRPDVVIAPDVGPELLTGSTRLKAGTATKLVLNLLTTLAMVRLGKTLSNLMVDLNPSNAKLRDRAVRVVAELTGADPATARAALSRVRWKVRSAVRLCRLRRPARAAGAASDRT